MRLCLAFVALVAVAGCGSSSTPTGGADLAMSMPASGDLAVYSLCGHPGDTGNSKGVGQYCMTSKDCTGSMATVCSTLQPIPQGPVYFCTYPCDPNASPSTCTDNTSCTCLDAAHPTLCGCVPDSCRVGLFG